MNYPVLTKDFQDALDAGLLSCRKHPTLDLWILNYTPEAQFSRTWTPVTVQCRGLVVDANGLVVARPFKKFFNLSEHDNPDFERVPIGTTFKAYEKMDGSLGISYMTQAGIAIATRGSFESEQSIKATEMLRTKYADDVKNMDSALTYLFEIIYPQNRIVIDYGSAEELVLLGVIHTTSGLEMPLDQHKHLSFRQPKVFDAKSIDDLPQDTENFEGYVIQFANGLRVKVKLDEYVRMHKLMTGITPNRLWEMLAAGDDVETAIKELPDEMYDEVMEEVDHQRAHHSSLLNLHVVLLESLELQDKSRKEQAQAILALCKRSQNEVIEKLIGMIVPLNSGIFFLLLDGQKELASKKTWSLIKPKDNNVICKADLQG